MTVTIWDYKMNLEAESYQEATVESEHFIEFYKKQGYEILAAQIIKAKKGLFLRPDHQYEFGITIRKEYS